MVVLLLLAGRAAGPLTVQFKHRRAARNPAAVIAAGGAKWYRNFMCTVVFMRRPDHDWPLILAANRDEMADRPWKPPARHWPDRPETIAGLDVLAGGSWLGMNDHGVVAGVLNRRESLGPDPRLRSRGELVLEALEHADAIAAAEALSHIDPEAYRSFNLFVADDRDACWLRSLGPGRARSVESLEIPEGVSMMTAFGLNAPDSARTARFLPLFEAARPPAPAGDWGDWPDLLARRDHDEAAGPREAMRVVTGGGFGTLSSSLIALGRPDENGPRAAWRFRDTASDTEWREISLESPPS
jgi:uncharacterized protein with NRDE domain